MTIPPETIVLLLFVFTLLHVGEIAALSGLLLSQSRTTDQVQKTTEQLKQQEGLLGGLAAAQVGYERHQAETRTLLARINDQVQALATEARMREIVRQEVSRGVTAIGTVQTSGGGAAVGGGVTDQRKDG